MIPSPTRRIFCLLALVLSAALAAAGGCGSASSAPVLTSQAFMAPAPGSANATLPPAAPMPATPVTATPMPAPLLPGAPLALPTTEPTPLAELAAVPTASTTPAGLAGPTTSASPTTLPSGQYMTLGGVVAEVNGTPIYANQVLAMPGLQAEFAAKARELHEDDFRDYAFARITDERGRMIEDELVYAAAERNLTEDEKKMVEGAAEAYRQRLITTAGGSIELARRQVDSQGQSFDDAIRDQYRKYMVDLFFTEKLMPRISINAQDMRQFYQENMTSLYADHDEARFRVIMIDPDKIGSRQAALEKIASLRKRAVAGQDFGQLARESNDPFLAEHGGDFTNGKPIRRHAYRYKDVEDAVWKLQPGQVSDIVECEGAYFIARLEEVKHGHIRPLEDVQDDIHNRLFSQQFQVLRDKSVLTLKADAIIRDDVDLIQPALEMTMQMYPQWARSK